MNRIKRMLLLTSCLVLAIGCYAVGIPAGGTVFLLLGVVFELLFWIGVFGRDKNR